MPNFLFFRLWDPGKLTQKVVTKRKLTGWYLVVKETSAPTDRVKGMGKANF